MDILIIIYNEYSLHTGLGSQYFPQLTKSGRKANQLSNGFVGKFPYYQVRKRLYRCKGGTGQTEACTTQAPFPFEIKTLDKFSVLQQSKFADTSGNDIVH